MSLRENLDKLDIAIHDMSQGINALEAMTMGLAHVKDPYADGFHALQLYLFQADMEVHRYLTACLNEI